MEARDPELRRELDATLQARGELGPEYESVLIDSFLEKVERRLAAPEDQRTRRLSAERRMAAARSASEPARPFGTFAERFGFGVVSLVLAVPLSAIGVANAGIDGLVVAWLGIVGVNAVHAAHTWPWARDRRRPSSDWDG
ncbi:hypothetical protein AB0D73_11055 [Streptomyces sp. NPDC048215]|uniref:hypothetical protein n=1 Tax=Streptomyces TaxID=1883 RepID=UPI0004C60722|nr:MULTISPECIES: hypothetical protein [Streptomyces]MDX3185255.1 hypothetical protein [Streptomyces sp. ME02-7008A-1]MDX3305920.1 hypothetical protein [Streptomyces sp. ME02-7008A]WSK29985.1 hypothetical protein OG483_19880 [[Kitasatospora] papulosa]